jgi:hypothetical protein
MFSSLDKQTRTAEAGTTSRLRLFVRITGVAVITGVLFAGLYLGILLAK